MKPSLGKPYFENIDALRFFAFLNVFLCHCLGIFNYVFPSKFVQLLHMHYFSNGSFGVSFFFVLSGFLITWLLLAERERNNKIQLGAFYMRRILRIWPVYFLVIGIGCIVGFNLDSPLLDRHNFNYRVNKDVLIWYLTFMANFEILKYGSFMSVIISVLWSVSVEEQFYVVWPLFFLFLKNKTIPFLCVIIIMISFGFRCFPTNPHSSYSTFEVMSFLAVGGWVAWHCLYKPSFTLFLKNLNKKTIWLIYILFMIYIPAVGFSHIFGPIIYSIYRPFEGLILSFFFSFIILEQIYARNSFFKFGRVTQFTKLGKISYGLYAYHMLSLPIVLFIVDKFQIPNDLFGYFIRIIFAFLLTVTMAHISYIYMEKNILSLKKYFQPKSITAN